MRTWTSAEPDPTAASAAKARQDRLVKPAGALGRLEEVSVWLSGVQGACPPSPLVDVALVIFAGDHGVAEAGVSAYPAEVTRQMVATVAAGTAAANVLARQVGARVRVLDLGVDGPLSDRVPAAVSRFHVRAGTSRIDRGPAMSLAEAEQALEAGATVVDEEVDAGAELLIAGDLGIANTTPAAVLVGIMTGRGPGDVVGRGTGVDDVGWMRKTAVVRDAMRRSRPLADDSIALLASAAGPDLAATVGFLCQAAARRTPVLLDGLISAACALVAERLCPGASRFWLAGSRSTEPAQQVALAELGLVPLLDLGMRLGEGTGALVAVPLLRAASATLAQMATFDEAGVGNRV